MTHVPQYQRQMVAVINKAKTRRIQYNQGDNAYDCFTLVNGEWQHMCSGLDKDQALTWYRS